VFPLLFLTLMCAGSSELAADYLKTLHWVLAYYMAGPPSWTWAFTHYFAPLLSGPHCLTAPAGGRRECPSCRALMPPVVGVAQMCTKRIYGNPRCPHSCWACPCIRLSNWSLSCHQRQRPSCPSPCGPSVSNPCPPPPLSHPLLDALTLCPIRSYSWIRLVHCRICSRRRLLRSTWIGGVKARRSRSVLPHGLTHFAVLLSCAAAPTRCA